MPEEKKPSCCCHFGRWTIAAIVLLFALAVIAWATMDQRKNIAETVKSMDNCSQFATCVDQAGLTDVLENEGPFTVFVPTDDAFHQVRAETLQALLDNKSALTSVILYHMIPKNVTSAEMENMGEIITCAIPQTAIPCGQHHYGKGRCLQNEIPCSNGLVYLIDTVQIPPFVMSAKNVAPMETSESASEKAINNADKSGMEGSEEEKSPSEGAMPAQTDDSNNANKGDSASGGMIDEKKDPASSGNSDPSPSSDAGTSREPMK